MSLDSGQRNRLCVETAAEANSTFLGNLERWIEATIECSMETNSTPEKMVSKVKKSYVRSLESNIQYHKILANLYLQTEDSKSPFYLRHKLLVDIYTSLLQQA